MFKVFRIHKYDQEKKHVSYFCICKHDNGISLNGDINISSVLFCKKTVAYRERFSASVPETEKR